MASVWMLNVGKQQTPNINFWFWYVQCTLKDRIDSHYGRQTDHKTELVLKFRTWIFLAQRHFHLWPRPKNSISNFQSVLFQLAPANHFFGQANHSKRRNGNSAKLWLLMVISYQSVANLYKLKRIEVGCSMFSHGHVNPVGLPVGKCCCRGWLRLQWLSSSCASAALSHGKAW